MTTTASTILTEKVRHPSSIGTTPAWLISKDFQEITTTDNGVTTTETQIRQYDGTNLLNVGNDYSFEYTQVSSEMTKPEANSNPSQLNWYTRTGSEGSYVYTKTTDTQSFTATLIEEPSGNPYEQEWYIRTGIGTEESPYVYTKTIETETEVDAEKQYCSIELKQYFYKEESLPKPIYINEGLFVPATSFGAASTLSLPISIEDGGTGATTAEEAAENLGVVSNYDFQLLTSNVNNMSNLISELTNTNSTSWTNPISILNGGTGATAVTDARTNLGLGSISTLSAAPGGYNYSETSSYRGQSQWSQFYIYAGTKVKTVNGKRWDNTLWNPAEFCYYFHVNPHIVHTDGSWTEDIFDDDHSLGWTVKSDASSNWWTMYEYIDASYNNQTCCVFINLGESGMSTQAAVESDYGFGTCSADYWSGSHHGNAGTAYPGWHAHWSRKNSDSTLNMRFNYVVFVPLAIHIDEPYKSLRKMGRAVSSGNLSTDSQGRVTEWWNPGL